MHLTVMHLVLPAMAMRTAKKLSILCNDSQTNQATHTH